MSHVGCTKRPQYHNIPTYKTDAYTKVLSGPASRILATLKIRSPRNFPFQRLAYYNQLPYYIGPSQSNSTLKKPRSLLGKEAGIVLRTLPKGMANRSSTNNHYKSLERDPSSLCIPRRAPHFEKFCNIVKPNA